jgi:dihydroxy-acid dehydratase
VPTAPRGYRQLFLKTVTQADQGVDFDFLAEPQSRGAVPRV